VAAVTDPFSLYPPYENAVLTATVAGKPAAAFSVRKGQGENAVRDEEVWRQAMLKVMTSVFRNLESSVPRAQMTKNVVGSHMRFVEQLPLQAIIQKLARSISGLNALKLLQDNGFLQEHAVIKRTLDEIDEDVLFLSYAEIRQEYTERHKNYLAWFWQEEFNHANTIRSTATRPTVSRKEIRAYISKVISADDPHTALTASRVIYNAYSGYVHAASPQVMDMCLGEPPRFQLNGTTVLYRLQSAYEDTWNYHYRAYCTLCTANMAFGNDVNTKMMMDFLREVDKARA
jgi:hypothetical protein